MATNTLSARIITRNDTAANWVSNNPILLQGEIGIERVTNKFKVGDGVTDWNSLAYVSNLDGTVSAIEAAFYPESSDYDYDIGTLWVGTVSEVTKIFILADVDGTTATWKQLLSPADADMLQSVFAPTALAQEKTGYVDNTLSADKVAHALTIGAETFDGSAAKSISSLPPNGSASGDLTGSYPSPTIKSGVNLPGSPTTTTQSTSDESTKIATTAYVKAKIDVVLAASDAMIFKGTLGTGGTITALPTTYSIGWAYKVITAGTYAGQACEVGDMLIAIVDRTGSGNANADWVIIQTNVDGSVTASATLVANTVLLGDGSKAVKTLANGTEGYVLKINSGVPAWAAETPYTAGNGISINSHVVSHSNAQITAVGSVSLMKVSIDANGHITGYSAITKADITALGIPESDTDTGVTSVVANNGLTQSINARQLTLGISSLSADLLTNGSNTLVLNGGTSA